MQGSNGNALPRGWRLQVAADPVALDRTRWNTLLASQANPTPFMRHEYLCALHASGSAVPETGWTPAFFLLWHAKELMAACPLYLKGHSWGEYVFDFAWARAYQQHGFAYYPKALIAVPFTPVPGSRLLAHDEASRALLLQQALQWCGERGLSSLHLLFGDEADVATAASCGLMPRAQVQFHWHNVHPGGGRPFTGFDDFLASLRHDKRKKIRQERRRVTDAGITFRTASGSAISAEDWTFFCRCYRQTYLEHGNAPYLTPEFFRSMARDLARHWVLFVAQRAGSPIACSLVALSGQAAAQIGPENAQSPVAYGRYWGALEQVDCLHFEACYYQPIAWCIANGITRFEGGAQGEHKLARALMPTQTHSMHWLAHPAFAEAVDEFLVQEGVAEDAYFRLLQRHSPYRA